MPNPSIASIGTRSDATLGNPATPGVPSGVGAGSIVVIVATNFNSTTGQTTPAGFQLLTSNVTTNPAVYVYWKRATGADSGTYTVDSSGVTDANSAVAFRLVDDDGSEFPFNLVDIQRSASQTATPNVSLADIAINDLLVWINANADGVSMTIPGGGFVRNTANIADEFHIASKNATALGATGNISGTASPASAHVSVLISVKAKDNQPSPQATTVYSEGVNASSSRNVAVPSGIAAGSLVLVPMAVTSNVSPGTPTGFATKVASPAGATPAIRLHWKRATGSESGNYSVPIGSATASGGAAAFRIEDEHLDADPFGQVVQVTGTAVTPTTAISMNNVRRGSMIIYMVSFTAARTTASPGAGWVRMTPDVSELLHMFYKIMPSGGSTGNVQVAVTGGATATKIALVELRRTHTVRLIGTPTTGGNTTGTSFVTTQPQTPSAGNVQILTVSHNKASPAATLSGLSGWTLIGSGQGTRLTIDTSVAVYARVCSGGESAPTIGTSVSTSLTWTIEEWAGLSGLPSNRTMTVANAGTAVVKSDSITPAADIFAFSVVLGRSGSSGIPGTLVVSGMTDDVVSATGRGAYRLHWTGLAYNGVVYNPTATITNSQGDGMESFETFEFPIAVPGTIIGDPIVGALRKVVVARSVIVSGVKKTITDVSPIVAGAKK